MKRRDADGRALVFAAVLVALAGFLFVFRDGERRVGEQRERNATVAARLSSTERMLRDASRTRAEAERLRGKLSAYGLDRDRTAVVAAFVRDASQIAAAHRTTVVAISAVASASDAPLPRPSTAPEPFDGVALDVRLSGRYRDLLDTMRGLSSGGSLASIDVFGISREAEASAPSLHARLRVVVQRLAPGHRLDVHAEHA